MYLDRGVRLSQKRTSMRENIYNADTNIKGNDTVSIKNRKFLTNNFLTIKEVDSNNKMHIKNEVFNTNIHYESHSTDINSENDDDVFEKPILNSINVTDTIQTAINNQIDDNYQKSISHLYQQEAEKDRKRNNLELVKLSEIFEGERVKKRRTLEEDELHEQSYNEDTERKQSILKDSHNRHAQALSKRFSELNSIKQNEESIEKEKNLKKEHEEERVIRKLEDENAMFQNHLSTLMSTIKQNMSRQACEEALDIQKMVEERIGRLRGGQFGGGENVGGAWGMDGFSGGGFGGKMMGRVGSRMNVCMQLNAMYKEAATELECVIAKESEKRKEMTPPTSMPATTIPTATTTSTVHPAAKKAITTESIVKTTRAHCQTSYLSHLKRHQEIIEQCQELNNDPKYKRYRFDLTAAVGRIISTLNSRQNTQLSSIIQLLEGDLVVCSGRQKVSSRDHPSAPLFCMDKLAKKIVEQATETSKINTTLYVSLALEVAASKPTFVPILLTHFALVCPITVPFHISKEGKSDQEYYRLLGYAVDDRGSMEDENTFLSRVTGYVGLFATLMLNGKVEGLSLRDVWLWLARVLDQAPIPGVTATALHKVLTIVENKMLMKYRRQYVKLLRFVAEVFVGKINVISDSDKKAPVIRLQLFVQKALKCGGIGGS